MSDEDLPPLDTRFSSLTIIYYPPDRKEMVTCDCDCGDVVTLSLQKVISGEITNCGCLSWLDRGYTYSN
jgi:hypothetical protein